MPKVKQITVSVADRPGALARVANVLGGAKVNILAFHGGVSGADGFVHLIVDKVDKAKKALSANGISVAELAVLCVEVPNKPGTLGQFAAKLAAKDINVTSAFGTTVRGSKKTSLVFAVSDLNKAARVR